MTLCEAQKVRQEALEKMKLYPMLRYGQAIFNALPDDVANQIRATEQDTFHMNDVGKVDKILYSLVEAK